MSSVATGLLKWMKILVYLFAFVNAVYSESLCGSRFIDLPSRTVAAPIVFEGQARNSHEWTQLGQTYYNFTFKVATLFKGSLPRESNGNGYRSIVVGVFGQKANKTRCVSPRISPGLSYVVFLSPKVFGRNRGLNIYRITSFPETSVKQTIEVVKNYSCHKCGRLPKSKIQTGHIVNGTLGKKLQLLCKVTGRPIPLVKWAKDDSPLGSRKGLRITDNSRGSKLQISSLKEDDLGLYKCQAMNVLGNSKWSEEVRIAVEYKTHSYPCSNNNYCLNNGSCFMLESLAIRYCRCMENFEGPRCEQKKVDIASISESPGKGLFDVQLFMPIVGVALGAVVLMSIGILVYLAIRSFWQRHQSKRAEEVSESSYRAYSLGLLDDSLKHNQRRQRSKASNTFLKDSWTQTEGSPASPRRLAIVRPDGISSGQVAFDQPTSSSSDSEKASNLRRGRLNGISATPPDFLSHRQRVHSPIAEVTSVSSDIAHDVLDMRNNAADILHGNSEHTLVNDFSASMPMKPEVSKRNSEYDNCWIEDHKENSLSSSQPVIHQNKPYSKVTASTKNNFQDSKDSDLRQLR